MKKTLCILLSVLILFSLAACGRADESGGTEQSPQPAAEDSPAPEDQDADSPEVSPEDAPAEEPGEKPESAAPDGEAPVETFDGSGGEAPGEPPEPPGEPPEGSDGSTPGTPPAGPGGEAPGEPPDGNGGGPGGTPPGGFGGGPGGKPGAPGGGPGGSDIEYSAAVEITSADSRSGGVYASSASDESALLISADAQVSIADPTVTKSGSSDGGDSCSFYGLNAAILVKGGADVTITDGTVTSDADGANGVFCYGGNGGRNGGVGDGATLTIRGTKIVTTGDGSGGIMTTGGGVTNAYDLDVTTSGRSSAPIRTDRGGGTVTVEGGTYTSNGLGSPAIYSTADVTVSGAKLTSNLSEGVCIEGLNSVTLINCDLAANNTKRNGNACFLDAVMIYQSMSGDADSGTGRFTMSGGTLTSGSGHVFHVTNTSAVITLTGVKILNTDPENVLLSVCSDGWSGGVNSAALKASAQKLEGAILVGSDSSLELELTAGSSFTGRIGGEITNAKGELVSEETGSVSVKLDSSSTWTLTGDSYITEFYGSASNVISNGYTLYVNGVALAGTK